MSNSKHSVQTIARILRMDSSEKLEKTFKKMEEQTGVKNVPEKIIRENEKRMQMVLDKLNVQAENGEEVFTSIKYHLKKSDRFLQDFFDQPSLSEPSSYNKVIDEVKRLAGNPKGWFLKEEKAKELLKKHPPEHMIQAFGYSGVDQLLQKEGLYEIYSSLRFIEPSSWMNNELLEGYKELSPEDFEKREIKVLVLPHKWLKLAQEFIEKKYHNLSHLKEMGVVFVIPIEDQASGTFLRLFSLLLHYLHEIPFYSRLFRRYAKSDDFSAKLIRALKGEVLEMDEFPAQGNNWMIVQRYLAKIDKQDPRLFTPHVNPETLHWEKAEDDIVDFAENLPDLELQMWRDLDWVGDFYSSKKEGEILVSFDLIDNVMSVVMEEELIKYLYHHQEALWNQIFEEYVGGLDKLEDHMLEHFDQGYIEL